jgi:succinyl-CoA synthetase beta subunit
MKIHEYQAKELLAAAGAPVPRGVVVRSAAEARCAFEQLGSPAILKAQIHAGGRGKGHFPGSGVDWGGVKLVRSAEEAAQAADIMLRYPLVTRQTGPAGQRVSTLLLVEAQQRIVRELYVGLVLDRKAAVPVLMACGEGGVEIEEVAARTPEKILREPVDPLAGLYPFQARKIAYALDLTGTQAAQAEQIFQALARVFLEKDCSLAEINPLAVTESGAVQVLDAKMVFDDNALFRHPELAALRDEAEEDPAELRAARAGLSYISLSGNIGCLVNGAGLAMATMDLIKYHGGEPANFLDVGGGVTPEGASEAFRILLADPRVRSVLVNIFGGIARCDLIAEALVQAGRQVGFRVPVVVRLEGTNVEKARQILAAAHAELPTVILANDLTDAAQKAVAAARSPAAAPA